MHTVRIQCAYSAHAVYVNVRLWQAANTDVRLDADGEEVVDKVEYLEMHRCAQFRHRVSSYV